MKIISHRGRLKGDEGLDNNPTQVLNCIGLGYDVEIDLWCVDNKLKLGHDSPEFDITKEFLLENSNNLWIHCKNLDALYYCSKNSEFNYFWHEEDLFTLTSKRFIWSFPKKDSLNILYSGENQIILDFSETPHINPHCYGICLDYIKI